MSVAPFPTLPNEHVHTVQFYGEDGVLLHELSSSIGSALSKGHSAVIIATQAHIDNLTRRLAESGLDVEGATAQGRYVALRATEVMAKFMMNGQPDPLKFSEIVGSVILRAAEASRSVNRRVIAFGEMVALLWAEGKNEAALQLEKLWNQLATTYSFSLHCAYPIR